MFKSSQNTKHPADFAFSGLEFRREDARTVSIGGGEEVMNSLAAALDSAKIFGG